MVIRTFSLSSEQGFVRFINRVMSFALKQNWRVIVVGAAAAAAGAWLYAHFTPKRTKRDHVSKEKPAAEKQVAETAVRPPEVNPFATGIYLEQHPLRRTDTAIDLVRHASPMLEPNTISDVPAECAPSPHSDTSEPDSKTKSSLPVQAGQSSRIRSRFQKAPADDESASAARFSQPLSSSRALQPSSSRIRSTMGQKNRR